MRWFRVYDDAINDPKILKLPEATRWHWIAVLCIASKNDGVLPSTTDMAISLRVTPAKASTIVAALKQAGLLDYDDGKFSPHNWSGRQYKSDTSNERVKRYRERKCNVTPTVTETAPETEQKQTTEQSRTEPRDELKIRTGNFQQAIVQAFAGANSPNLPETSRAGLWLSQGYQEDICLAVIAELVRKKPSITTLNYFDSAIREAHAAKAPPRQAVAMDTAEINWDRVLTDFKKFGRWSKWAGPDLESPACRAPAAMLLKHGLAKIHDAPPIPIPKTMMGNA